MLARKFFQAARAINQNGLLITSRGISSTPAYFYRQAPPLPTLSPDVGEEYDPKQESLESFLNLNFGPNYPTINDDKNPQRDLKNFPRPVQPDFAEPCRLGIMPESWFHMFYNKTGVTGPYMFFGGLTTFLLSKEWLVFEHELLVGIEATIILVVAAKVFGPKARKSICEKVDANLQQWDDWQQGMINFLNEYISIERNIRDAPADYKVLFDAKRENIQLQLEAEFRRRQMQAYNEVRRRLDFLVAKDEALRQFQQKHMVNWIIDSVAKSITPQQEKETLKTTLADLKKLAAKSPIV